MTVCILGAGAFGTRRGPREMESGTAGLPARSQAPVMNAAVAAIDWATRRSATGRASIL